MSGFVVVWLFLVWCLVLVGVLDRDYGPCQLATNHLVTVDI